MMKRLLVLMSALAGLSSPLWAQTADQCVSFKSPDGHIEYTRETSSAPCLERKVVSVTDYYLGASWKLEGDKLVFSPIPAKEDFAEFPTNNCVAIQPNNSHGKLSINLRAWSSKEECTPAPLPNFPQRTIRVDMTGATLCIAPGDACVPLTRLDTKTAERLAKIGIEGIAEAFLKSIIEPEKEPI